MDNLIDAPVSLKRDAKSYGYVGSACEASDYPCVTIDGPEALNFPEEGIVTFHFKRGQIVARSASRGQPASASVPLQLTKLCGIEEAEPDESYEAADIEGDPIDRLFNQAQIPAEEAE